MLILLPFLDRGYVLIVMGRRGMQIQRVDDRMDFLKGIFVALLEYIYIYIYIVHEVWVGFSYDDLLFKICVSDFPFKNNDLPQKKRIIDIFFWEKTLRVGIFCLTSFHQRKTAVTKANPSQAAVG